MLKSVALIHSEREAEMANTPYLTSEEYSRLSTDAKAEVLTHFEAYEAEAERLIDALTSGIDNVKKLRIAFPTDENDALAVKLCMIELMNISFNINQAATSISEEAAEGRSGVIGSISSGSESISYVTGDDNVLSAAQNPAKKQSLFYSIVRNYLSGVTDKNGVNLLFGGDYPCIRRP